MCREQCAGRRAVIASIRRPARDHRRSRDTGAGRVDDGVDDGVDGGGDRWR
jgi:hypothetical protein